VHLYLVQHAEASREEEDPSRGLTDKGVRDIGRTAVFAAKLPVRLKQILHSGKKRALQTAEILGEYLVPEEGISETSGLSPMDDPQIWAERISAIGDNIMLVGHLPHLSRFASLLLCGDKNRRLLDFEMGGIVCLRREGDCNWTLDWMIVPEVIN
jgi:phosphohistidine phosphatase